MASSGKIIQQLRRIPGLAKLKRNILTPLFFPPSPQRCSSLCEIAESFGGRAELLLRKEMTRYSLPGHSSPDINEFFAQWSEVDVPNRIVANIPKGRVYGEGIVISPDGQQVARDVSIVFRGSPDDHPILGSPFLAKARRIANQLGVAASVEGHTYYHWLFDVLPRLCQLAEKKVDRVYVQESSSFCKEWLALFPFEVIPVSSRSHFVAEELVVPSLPGRTGHPTADACQVLREKAAELSMQAVRWPEKVIITRRTASRRRLLNEYEIECLLAPRGYKCIDPGTLSVGQQVSLFSSVKEIVATHGAGLANLVFCQPGTKVVELMNREAAHWCYWQLATLVGLEYTPLVSDGHGPVVNQPGFGSHNFRIQANDVLNAVDALTDNRTGWISPV